MSVVIPNLKSPLPRRVLYSLGAVCLFTALFFLTSGVFHNGEYLFIFIPVVTITLLHGLVTGIISTAVLMTGTYFLLRPATDPSITAADLYPTAGMIIVALLIFISAYLRWALKKNAERDAHYRAITEYTYDSEYWYDTKGNLIYQSPSAERITGYPAEVFLEGEQDFYLKMIHPDDREGYINRFHKKTKETNEPITHRYRITTKQGEVRWMESISQKVYDDSGVYLGIRGTTRDITERKRFQQALEESEREYRTIVSHANSAIIKYNMDGTITFINRFGEELFGYPAEEIVGKRGIETINKPRNQNEYAETKAFLKKLIENPEDYANNINQNTKKDGTRIWVAWTNAPLYDNEGRLTSIICIGTDTTEKIRDEKTIKQNLEEKEILLREIHHRVKNNLQIISSMIRLQHSTINSEEDLDIFITCENRITSMALIHDHLYQSDTIARIEAADYIPSLCEAIFDSYNANARKLKMDFYIDPISIDIDTAVPCGLIITELVSNSIKHGFPLNTTGKIEVRLSDSDAETVLEVRDNGKGMDPAAFQSAGTGNNRSLGLKLVDALVSQLKGSIDLSCGHGVRWTIRISPSLHVCK